MRQPANLAPHRPTLTLSGFDARAPEHLWRAGLAALRTGDEPAAILAVRQAIEHHPHDPRLWQVLGLLHRSLDELSLAVIAFERAAMLAPRDGRIALGYAQSSLEAGFPAVRLFEAALRLASDETSVQLGLATARLADGRLDQAADGLAAALRRRPQWIAGHAALSRMRWMNGDSSKFTHSFQKALRDRPQDLELWKQLAAALRSVERYDDALGAIRRARAIFGDDEGLGLDEAICLSESWQLAEADARFARVSTTADPATEVYRLRHLLRSGRADAAASLALSCSASADKRLIVPYLSLAWRAMGDDRWRLIEQGDKVGVYDLVDRELDLASLAGTLRVLHAAQGAPPEQSLRNGTQTDGQLFRRAEPDIRRLREACTRAGERHVHEQRMLDADHASNLTARCIRYAGSWSVRLGGSGHHRSHVHPEGWLSSAFYVSMPEDDDRGPAPNGSLLLGLPPDDLGLDLPALNIIEAKAGRLVLFPSTMWHATAPFDAGERLTVAFDIAFPRFSAART